MLSFNEMADNIYKELEDQKKNVDNLIIPKPIINIQSNKKTVWKNAYHILDVLKRSKESEHFLKYLFDQIKSEVAWKKEKTDGLMIDKFLKFQDFNNLLVKYIKGYVECDQCSNIDTRIKKDKKSRLWKFRCMVCNHTKNFTSFISE